MALPPGGTYILLGIVRLLKYRFDSTDALKAVYCAKSLHVQQLLKVLILQSTVFLCVPFLYQYNLKELYLERISNFRTPSGEARSILYQLYRNFGKWNTNFVEVDNTTINILFSAFGISPVSFIQQKGKWDQLI